MSAATEMSPSLLLSLEQKLLRALPSSVFGALGRNAPINDDGDRLAPEIAGLLAVLNRLPGSDFSKSPLDKARRQIDEEAYLVAEQFPPFAVEEDLTIGGVPATRYRAREGEPRGLILYFHGGGWVLGSRVSTDPAVRFLAVHTGADVVSVDYRLAPEHPFPAAIEDGRAAYAAAVQLAPSWGIDPDAIVLAGDSAGGNISAALGLQLRDHAHPPVLQVLFCPVLDLSTEHPSYEEFADGYFLTRAQMRWYIERYLPDPAQGLEPDASPLLAQDLAGLSPVYIGVAGFDPLRDEGLAYARRLEEAGVEVTLHRASGLVHAYVNMTGFSDHARVASLHATRAIVAALEAR
ncbi:MAG: alpha/beta hydrolase [Cellulomonadaceae bacterium]